MDINYAKNQITLYGKVCRLDTLIKKLSSLSGNQVYNFLIDRTTMLPRKMNCLAMISVLNNRIKFLHSNSLPKDTFAKLQYYEHFTEHQLFMLFNKICNEEDFLQYRMNLFGLILDNYQELALNDGELMYLKNLNKSKMESFADYCNYISVACMEQDDTFDGVEIEDLKANLQYSASNQDVFDIAGKYSIELPQRLKKDQYLEYIYDYLKRKGTYTEAIVEELSQMNITQLSTYARRTGINMQPNMSKTDLITYLFYYLDQCVIPSTSVQQIKAQEKYLPLEFRVDLQAIDSFNSFENKKVIYYAGDHEDQEQMNTILETDKPEPEVVSEYIEEETQETAEAEAVVEAPAEEEAPAWKFIVKNHEENKAKEEEALLAAQKEEEQKALENLLAEDIINETLAQIPEKKIEEEPEEPLIAIDVNKMDANPELGTGKIEKLAVSRKKAVIAWMTMILAVGIIAFCLVELLILK